MSRRRPFTQLHVVPWDQYGLILGRISDRTVRTSGTLPPKSLWCRFVCFGGQECLEHNRNPSSLLLLHFSRTSLIYRHSLWHYNTLYINQKEAVRSYVKDFGYLRDLNYSLRKHTHYSHRKHTFALPTTDPRGSIEVLPPTTSLSGPVLIFQPWKLEWRTGDPITELLSPNLVLRRYFLGFPFQTYSRTIDLWTSKDLLSHGPFPHLRGAGEGYIGGIRNEGKPTSRHRKFYEKHYLPLVFTSQRNPRHSVGSFN